MHVHTLRKSFKWLMLPYVFQYYYNRQSNLNKNEVTSNNMLKKKKNKNYKKQVTRTGKLGLCTISSAAVFFHRTCECIKCAED